MSKTLRILKDPEGENAGETRWEVQSGNRSASELIETLVVRDRSTAPESIGNRLAHHATTVALVGRIEAARATAAEALKISDSPTVALAAAQIYARIGPPATARALLDRFAQDTPPTDTLVNALGLPLARALLESSNGVAAHVEPRKSGPTSIGRCVG